MTPRRKTWLVRPCGGFMVGTIVLVAGWLATSPRAEGPKEAAPALLNASAEDERLWVGVGGCAAAACHGGEVERPRGEYTTWISRDPHARAYSVLFGEASREMARQLAGGDGARSVAPHEDRRCLACHAPTGPASQRSPQIVGDGVGCEACHGGAENWAAQHVTIDWKSLAPAAHAAKRQELGMINTRDPLVRAEQCVRCHVGEGEADVTHDLIAAGHPRLSFEMGAFHAQLPKHWPHEEERRRDRSFEAKLWAVGQMTSAAAHFELLAARAERANGVELANYDCYACHHELRSPSLRPPAHGDDPPGSLRPLTWYLPDPAVWKVFGGDEAKALASLDADRAALVARPLAERLRGWAIEQQLASWGESEIDEAIVKLVNAPPPDATWDQATQWYLALVALERARLDHQDNPPADGAAERNEQFQAALEAIQALLEFPAGRSTAVINSPRDFDPRAFATAAERLAKLVGARSTSTRGAP